MIKGFPSFSDYFLFHGQAEGEKRILKLFHRQICSALQLLILNELPDSKINLLIEMPPRHGKTFLIRDFVSYGIGAFPDSEWIYTSYAAQLAVTQTAKIKTTIQKEWYQSIFEVLLEKESEAYFTTTAGGSVFGVGVGGPITGFGAGKKRKEFGGAIIIDDAMKADEARSEAAKIHVVEWYHGVLTSRRNYKDTPIIMINHRLAPDDLAGHILKTEPELWYVIRFPALQLDGTALWEETASAEFLKKLRDVDAFTFFSQYQQQPQIEGGNIIKRDWWKFHDAYTEDIKYRINGLVFLTADTAMKKGNMNDFTAIGAWHATRRYLDKLDLDRGKYEFPELLRRACAFWEKWKRLGAQFFAIEDKVSGTSLGQMLAEKGIPVILWKPADYEYPDDKVGRVKMTTWFIEAGRMRLPNGRPEIADSVIDECAAFSGSDTDTDDIVDEVTMAASIWKSKGGGDDIEVLNESK